MKQRLITAGVGLVLFFIVMVFYSSFIFDIILCLVALLIVHELLMAEKITQNTPLTVAGLLMATIPFIVIGSRSLKENELIANLAPTMIMGIVAVMFLILLKYHEKLPFEKIAFAFFVGLIVPFSMSTLIQLRNDYGVIKGFYFTLLVFACAWGSDSGAYFIGRFFGKRKLSPKISPNKTIEGVYGGVISCILFVLAVTGVYSAYSASQGVTIEFHWLSLLILSIVGSLSGVLGDLTASVVKRQTGIKDFGSIMPGHGGALDRFDSVLFVAPVLWVLFKVLPF